MRDGSTAAAPSTDERQPLGSPVGFRSREFQSALQDIDPPSRVIKSASPFRRQMGDVAPAKPPDVLESPIAKRQLAVPAPAVAAAADLRPQITPHRFGRLSASAVATTQVEQQSAGLGTVLSPRATSASVYEARALEADALGGGEPLRSPRGRSAPAFGRVAVGEVAADAHGVEAGPDDPSNYAQYTEYTQQGQQVGDGEARGTAAMSPRGKGTRGTSAPLQRIVPVPPAAQASERGHVHSAPATRAGVDAHASAGGGGAEGGADDDRSVGSGGMGSTDTPSDGKKSAGSGFFSSLFGGLMGGRKTSTLVARGRSAPTKTAPAAAAAHATADSAASRPPSQDAVTHMHRGRAVPTSAPESRRDAVLMASSGNPGATRITTARTQHQSRPPSTKSQLPASHIPHPPSSPSPRPAALAGGAVRLGSGEGEGGLGTVASSGKGSGSRAASTLSRIAELQGAGVEGGGVGGEGEGEGARGAGWEEEENAETLDQLLQPAGAGIGSAARELFELAKMGDLEGLQSLVLALSLGGKGNDVVTLRDPQGMTLLLTCC